MNEFLSCLTGCMAVGLAFACIPLFTLFIIYYESRKEERNEKIYRR